MKVKYWLETICNQIADVVVTDCLQHDKNSRVAIEILIADDQKKQFPDIALGVDYNRVSAYGHFGWPGFPWEEIENLR